MLLTPLEEKREKGDIRKKKKKGGRHQIWDQ
jgi:hypothetical protein